MPFFSSHGFGVEDGPNRPTAVGAIANSGQGGIDKVRRCIFNVCGIAIVPGPVGINGVVVIGGELGLSLIIESQPNWFTRMTSW